MKLMCIAMMLSSAAGFQFDLDANGCLINFDPAVDYFPPELRAMVAEGGTMPTTVTFATDFSIDYHHTFKVLRNLKNGKVYVLHQCGAGDISTIAADLPADAVDAPVFEVPVQSWSTGSTVPIAFMELLGLIGKAALIDPQYASSACTQKLHQCGVIDTVVPGWPHTMYSAFANASRASGSTVHWTDDWGTGQAFSDIDVAFDSTSDPGALARVEWIKFVAAFFNLEPHANRIFAEIKAEYDQTEAAAAAALAAGTVAPKVLWISAASAWGPATISTVSYKMDLTAGAGGATPPASELAAVCTDVATTLYVTDAHIAEGCTPDEGSRTQAALDVADEGLVLCSANSHVAPAAPSMEQTATSTSARWSR
jgi:hypothetical protein